MYGVTEAVYGNGFMGVYVCGLTMGNLKSDDVALADCASLARSLSDSWDAISGTPETLPAGEKPAHDAAPQWVVRKVRTLAGKKRSKTPQQQRYQVNAEQRRPGEHDVDRLSAQDGGSGRQTTDGRQDGEGEHQQAPT